MNSSCKIYVFIFGSNPREPVILFDVFDEPEDAAYMLKVLIDEHNGQKEDTHYFGICHSISDEDYDAWTVTGKFPDYIENAFKESVVRMSKLS